MNAMCGICGFVDGRGLDSGAPDLLKRMTRTLIHRGPDDEASISMDKPPWECAA